MTSPATEVPCATCGRRTRATETERCARCWEIEHRLKDYLQQGGERAHRFVEAALECSRHAAIGAVEECVRELRQADWTGSDLNGLAESVADALQDVADLLKLIR